MHPFIPQYGIDHSLGKSLIRGIGHRVQECLQRIEGHGIRTEMFFKAGVLAFEGDEFFVKSFRFHGGVFSLEIIRYNVRCVSHRSGFVREVTTI
jgi:hypothetical protein